jgi:GT2 family glycosyltransferase
MPNIHYLSPYSLTLDIGNSINEAIDRLNADDNDWICLTDGDAMFLLPEYGSQINTATTKHGHEYNLITCLTNRLGNEYQTIDGMFDEMDISKHYEMAKYLQSTFKCTVEDYKHDCAGFFMLFPVHVWRSVGGFKNNLMFDSEFTKHVRMKGGKVGIMKGLYMFHAYRLWAKTRKEAKNSNSHLIR